jgi:asparagine N-glycosylation enzyme membrane subunit Stt3
MKTTFIVIFLLLLGATTATMAQDYFPLTEGATWSYSYGPMYDGGEIYTYTEKVLSEKKVINGKKYTAIEREEYNAKNELTKSVEYYRVNKNQEIVIYDDYNKADYVTISTVLGKEWEVPFINCRVIDVDGTIKTPAGDYTDCLVIEMLGGESIMEYYFDKKLGLVGVMYQERLVCHLVKSSLE